MLAMRARAWALRDAFPDLLKGILPVEEARDIDAQPQSVTAEVIESVPPPQPAVAKDDLVPAARAAIKRARSADGLSKLRARIEARVMNGDMDAADAEQLVNELEQKLHTLEEENADSE
jgi:predicted AlkP superfamily phosphohydrolase/phosphomutase